MASLSHDLPTSAGLGEAIKRIIKQHQRDCENAGEFGKAREARAALLELQHQSELEGLCQLFCKHYTQLSDAEKAYEKQLRLLTVNWETQQLPELLEKVRRWQHQLQERHAEELATLAPSKTDGHGTAPRPRFKREAFDVQKKVLFLGHQGRYDEAEELQKKLAVRQRMDAAEHQAVLKARRERLAQRLLAAQETERLSLQSKVERLVSHHNRQNAEAIDVLRRKYLGQRKSLIHVQALETQKYLHALRSFTPKEAIRMASSVVSSQWKAPETGATQIDSPADAGFPRSNNFLRILLSGETGQHNSETAVELSVRKTENKGQKADRVAVEDSSQAVKLNPANCSAEIATTEGGTREETRKRQLKPPTERRSDSTSKWRAIPASVRGTSTSLHRLITPLRKSLTTNPPRPSPATKDPQSWKRLTLSHQSMNGSDGSVSQGRPPHNPQEANKRRTADQLHDSTRTSHVKRPTEKCVTQPRPREKGKPPQPDTLRDEIFDAWRECAAKVTSEHVTADTLR